MHELAGDLVGAATTLAGLMLVFLGGLYNNLQGQDAETRAANLKSYRFRARVTFGPFVLAVLTTVIATIAHASQNAQLTWVAVVLLTLVLCWLLVAAFFLVTHFR